MIIVKNKKIFLNLLLVSYDPLLVSILGYIDKKYGKAVITSGYRKGDKGVHDTVPCRGLDIRSHVYYNPSAEDIVEDINNKWWYDPKRLDKKVIEIRDIGNSIHMHLQVHPNTIFINEEDNE